MKHPRIIAGLVVACGLIVPVLTFAQTSTGSQAGLLALLEQLLTTLEGEIQQLVAQQSASHTNDNSQQDYYHPDTPTCSLHLEPSVVYAGGSATLYWTSTGATTGTVTPGVGTVSANGSQFVADLTQGTTWNGTFTGASGTATCSTTLTVIGGSGGTSISSSFSVTPTTGTAPLTVTFSGSAVGNSNFTLDFGDGSASSTLVCTGGCTSVAVNATHTYSSPGFYTAILRNYTGVTVGVETIWVRAGAPSGSATPSITSFSASPASISSGQSSTLSWSVSNATSVSINGIGTETGTSTQVFPSQTTTYTLTAANGQNVATAQTTVTVAGGSTGNTSQSFSASPTSGTAPLAVVFRFLSDQPAALGIQFGDGTSGGMGTLQNGVYQTTHTYAGGGTFTAGLSESCAGSACIQLPAPVTITVSGASAPGACLLANTVYSNGASLSYSTYCQDKIAGGGSCGGPAGLIIPSKETCTAGQWVPSI